MNTGHTVKTANDVFDMIGPVMVGPSSSHTAGAVRIGRLAMEILGSRPVRAVISLHGSFQKSCYGHGTDKAILAGLLGFSTDDSRIPFSRELALEAHMDYTFKAVDLPDAHPNTAVIEMWDAGGRHMAVRGVSIGGGSIIIESIDGFDVSITGDNHTLVIVHEDVPGVIATVSNILAEKQINVANMSSSRSFRGGPAVMVIEIDQLTSPELNDKIRKLAHVRSLSVLSSLRM